MAKKLGQASKKGRFVSDQQPEAINDMLSGFMEELHIQEGSIRDLSDAEKIQMVPTNIMNLDAALKGGIPVRTMVELFGDSGGGKSWLAQKIAASITYEGGKCFFIDAELAFNPFRAQDVGLDLSLVTYWDGFDTGPQVLDMICKLLNDPEWDRPYPQPKPYRVIVLDSIAVLPSQNDLEADMVMLDPNSGKPKMKPGSKAKMMSEFQRKMAPAFSRSPGVWTETRSFARYHNESFPLDKSSMPDDIRKELVKLAKKRTPYGYDLYKPDAQEEIGNIPDDVAGYEKLLGGQVVEVRDDSLVTMHYNPGPILVVVNQVRMSGFGSYAGPSKTTTGGQALLYSAGTRINIEPVGGKKGEIVDQQSKELISYVSRAKIVKSRYTTKAIGIQINIPVGESAPDAFDEFLSMLAAKDMYQYSRGFHRMPKDDPFIKTKDNDEFLAEMLETGIDWAAEQLKMADEQVAILKEHCVTKLEQGLQESDEAEEDDVEEEE